LSSDKGLEGLIFGEAWIELFCSGLNKMQMAKMISPTVMEASAILKVTSDTIQKRYVGKSISIKSTTLP